MNYVLVIMYGFYIIYDLFIRKKPKNSKLKNKKEIVLQIEIIDPSLKDKYKTGKLIPKNQGDSGFDLYFPKNSNDIIIGSNSLVGLGIKCALYVNEKPSSFYLYPRSSISKTQFRLANSVGIIDAGYRGELKASIDCLFNHSIMDSPMVSLPQTPLFQICTPTLEPIDRIEIVDELSKTERGDGGFGSTNKN